MTSDNRRWQSQHVFVAWGKIVQQCERYFGTRAPALLSLDRTVVTSRLLQLIEATGFQAFCCLCVQRLEDGLQPIPPDGEGFEVGGLLLGRTDGTVRLRSMLVLRSLYAFLREWRHVMTGVLLGFLSRYGKDPRSAAIIYGLNAAQILYVDNGVRFIQFCRNGPITPLGDVDKVLIQTIGYNGYLADSTFACTANPVRTLVRDGSLGWVVRFRLFIALLFVPMEFLSAVVRCRPLCLLGGEIAQSKAIAALDKQGLLRSVIITNSVYSFQPLWMRKANGLRNFRVHKIHYSQNGKPLIFKCNPIVADFPALSHVKVDEHWVWTSGYGDYLKELGHGGSVHVVGPITFYGPEIKPTTSDSEIKIAVFDITPVPDDVAKKLGVMNIYYSTDIMIRFIDDIYQSCCELESIMGRRIRILLKHKREFTKGVHDDRYIGYVADMTNTHRAIDIVPHDNNIYDFLSGCDLSISIPYTTAAYVSDHLGQHAIYYDPTMELLPSYEGTPFVRFASGRPELDQLIENSLSANSLPA
jgi:hypothetical protein